MMKRALFISDRFPQPLDTSVSCTYMRMRMMLEALSAETEELDLLFFAPRNMDIKDDGLACFQSELNCKWGIRANLRLCRKSKLISTWSRPLASLIDARNDRRYART